MTHSFFIHLLVTIVAALFAAAILWGEHYHPWGKPLDQRLNYVLGTLAMLIPYSFLILFWMFVPPGDAITFGLFALVGLWIIVSVSGLTVHLLYETDAKREAKQRAAAAEEKQGVTHEPKQSVRDHAGRARRRSTKRTAKASLSATTG